MAAVTTLPSHLPSARRRRLQPVAAHPLLQAQQPPQPRSRQRRQQQQHRQQSRRRQKQQPCQRRSSQPPLCRLPLDQPHRLRRRCQRLLLLLSLRLGSCRRRCSLSRQLWLLLRRRRRLRRLLSRRCLCHCGLSPCSTLLRLVRLRELLWLPRSQLWPCKAARLTSVRAHATDAIQVCPSQATLLPQRRLLGRGWKERRAGAMTGRAPC